MGKWQFANDLAAPAQERKAAVVWAGRAAMAVAVADAAQLVTKPTHSWLSDATLMVSRGPDSKLVPRPGHGDYMALSHIRGTGRRRLRRAGG